jgi:glycosyltransferase 2 family protein
VSKRWRLWGSILLVSVIAWRLDWGQVRSAFASLDVRLWLAALGVFLLAQVASALRWQLLARPLGLSGGLGRYTAYYFIGMFFNLVLPTSVGGDVVRAWYLARQAGPAPPAGRRIAAFLSVLADRANGLAVLIAVACAGLWYYPVPLPAWVTYTVVSMGAAVAAGLAVLPFMPRLHALLPHRPRVQQVVGGVAVYLRHHREVVAATFLSLVVQLANVVIAWLIGAGLGLAVPFPYYCILMSVVAVLTLLPVSVNGMGLREWGTVLLLSPLSVGSAEAVTLSLLTFAVQALASLGGAVFYLFGRFPRFAATVAASGPLAGSETRASEPLAATDGSPGREGRSDAQSVGGGADQGRARQPPAAA